MTHYRCIISDRIQAIQGISRNLLVRLAAILILLSVNSSMSSRIVAGDLPDDPNLPIDVVKLRSMYELAPHAGVRNAFSIEQIHAAIRDGDSKGLAVDFDHVKRLLNGTKVNSRAIYGRAWIGFYPFETKEARYAYKRFRKTSTISAGEGVLDVPYLLRSYVNSEDWTQPRGQLCVRFELWISRKGADQYLGIYDTRLMLDGTSGSFRKINSILEGPSVNRIQSDDPQKCVIALRTSEACRVTVEVDDIGKFQTPAESRRHEIEIQGLEPSRQYGYTVTVGLVTTRKYTFQTAPKRGQTGFVFAYGGDSREGEGGGTEALMGTNYAVLERLVNLAYVHDAALLIQGGDLINGYSTSKADFRTQLHAWKQAIAGFQAERPVYPTMGNHEALTFAFLEDGKANAFNSIDKWPYQTDSAEAVFAEEMINPTNGPETSDPRRPTYKENVFSFHYGCVKFIAVNNNYWHAAGVEKYNQRFPQTVGGCPEGYLLPDQVNWLSDELKQAEGDPLVKYIIVYMQEPMFPNGGHIADSMWHFGNNGIRAHTFQDGKLVPEEKGVIEVRNELAEMLHGTSKVAAVLGCDEHGYSRVLISREVPIGNLLTDDRDRDGRVDGRQGMAAKPLTTLRTPLWHFVGGGFGAPHYNREPTPWNEYWLEKQQGSRYFKYSSQANILLFDVNDQRIGVKVYSPYGELIDRVDDLMAIREG
jgi:hypothetical protein